MSSEFYADYVLPALKEQVAFPLPWLVVSRENFDSVTADCRSLFQTTDFLKEANFHHHLLNMNAHDGIRLSTAEMMIQGFENGGDILRMANNMIKFKQAETFVKNSEEFKNKEKSFQVYSLSVDDFIIEPAESFKRFLDFVFDRNSPNVSQRHRQNVAKKYEQYFLEKVLHDVHVTHSKHTDTEELKEFLRQHPVYGPPLSKIELIVNQALTESRGRNLLPIPS